MLVSCVLRFLHLYHALNWSLILTMDRVSAVATQQLWADSLLQPCLQSCKVIYQAISVIRDTSISGLDRILHQVTKLIESAEQLAGTQDSAVFEALRPFLAACTKDLTKLQAKLLKLKGNQSNGIQKTWSVAEHVLRRDEFDAAHAAINRHLQVLSIQLSIAGR